MWYQIKKQRINSSVPWALGWEVKGSLFKAQSDKTWCSSSRGRAMPRYSWWRWHTRTQLFSERWQHMAFSFPDGWWMSVASQPCSRRRTSPTTGVLIQWLWRGTAHQCLSCWRECSGKIPSHIGYWFPSTTALLRACSHTPYLHLVQQQPKRAPWGQHR